jgi:Rrf2 family iron-sulfur cluster assembly transcriptional regulator
MLVHLAGLPAGTRMTSHDLAAACGVSAGNVPTLVANLSRAEILECTPGRGGGCRLARPGEEITVAEVVAALEGSLELDRCSIDERRCVDREYFCGMHRTWSAAHADLIANLSRLTLAEAVERERANAGGAGRRPRRRST